jgi:hypothetical protein
MMKKVFGISVLCTLLFLFITGNAMAQIVPGCARASDETTRIETARALLDLNMGNYASVINYWAEDITYKEPVLTNSGRQEMLDYLEAMFGGTAYGYPNDRAVTIKDQVATTHPDGSMTYMATLEWTGTFGTGFFIQTGMSIIKFAPGEGCPSYHRDYFTEGDTWWNIPLFLPEIRTMRDIYVLLFGLGGRCFDGDGDGYSKYGVSTGCPNGGTAVYDCNDFVAEINPGATEIPGNGVDDDCKPITTD